MLGSFLIFFGVISLFWNYYLGLRDEVYSDMKIAMMDSSYEPSNINDVITGAPTADNVATDNTEAGSTYYEIDYSKYLGVLEIPKIGLKRGFYDVTSRYNDIQYNVTMVQGSTTPDVVNGNLILMAHSGDAYISYFAYLWRLNIGDMVYVTYHGVKYSYQITNIYQVEKNGVVLIQRNYDKTSLTMITCTKDDDSSQTIYISEQVG